MASKNKVEKVVETKAAKVLSPKRQSELFHIEGRHKATTQPESIAQATFNPECGFCQRRASRYTRRHG